MIDLDVFEEHNLNRRCWQPLGLVGRAKIQAAAARIAEINPTVKLVPIQSAWQPERLAIPALVAAYTRNIKRR